MLSNQKRLSWKENPWILFSPFLLIFILYAILNPPIGNSGDETRYLTYASNLINGYYSPSAPNVELINGPGFPIFLMPFVALGLPLLTITLFNALLYYFSIVVLYNSLRLIVSAKATIIFSLLWACYYVAYQGIPLVHTEVFTYFLVTLVVNFVIKTFHPEFQARRKQMIAGAGLSMGYLVLTKMIFGHVLVYMMIFTLIIWLFQRKSAQLRQAMAILLIAFGVTLPYLVYTWNLTGKFLFWGEGNDSLYWMTTKSPNEYGSWFPNPIEDNDPVFLSYYIPGTHDSLIAHHKEALEDIRRFSGIDKDDAYYRHAIKNIKEHPERYIENYFYNLGRLVFHYPFSYGMHRPKVLIVFPIQGIMLTLILLSTILTLMNWKKMPFPLRFFLFIALLYLGGSSVVTAYIRMFTVAVPFLLVWIAYVLDNALRIDLEFFRKN